MLIGSISLYDFRNYRELALSLPPGVTVFYGENAQGKTNLLEAVLFLSIGRSERARRSSELINHDADQCSLSASVVKDGFSSKISAFINRTEAKTITVNGVAIKRLGDLFGKLITVAFSPEDLKLIKSGPAARRRLMDLTLCQLSHMYYYELKQYYRALSQRNALLKTLRHNPDDAETIFAWDAGLCEWGQKITEKREHFIQKLSGYAGAAHSHITGGCEKLEISYRPDSPGDTLADRLSKSLKRDIILGATASGPHKDDLVFLINGRDAKSFASQGQQRTAALSARLAEIELIKEQKGEPPVLLLDDVLSELDTSRQNFLLDTLGETQALITCTDAYDLKERTKASGWFKVSQGTVSAG